MLKIDSISKTFFAGTANERKALVDVSLHLNPGDFVTVIGSNGSRQIHLAQLDFGSVNC